MCVQLYSPALWDRCPASQPASQPASSQARSQSTRLHPAGRGGLQLSLDPRYSRASLGSLGRPQRGITQCQTLTAPLTLEAGRGGEGKGGGVQKPVGPPPILTLTTPVKTTFPPCTPALSLHPSQHFHPYWTPPSSFSSSSPFLSALHPSWSSFDSGLSLSLPSSILPAPAVLQPTTVSYWFIDCCLPVGERPQPPSLPLLSPAWICLPFSPPFFSLHALSISPSMQ